jgi:hypothetical protein
MMASWSHMKIST